MILMQKCHMWKGSKEFTLPYLPIRHWLWNLTRLTSHLNADWLCIYDSTFENLSQNCKSKNLLASTLPHRIDLPIQHSLLDQTYFICNSQVLFFLLFSVSLDNRLNLRNQIVEIRIKSPNVALMKSEYRCRICRWHSRGASPPINIST